MERLQYISLINPEWAVTIFEFMESYPEFKPFAYLAPMQPNEPIPYHNVHTLFQALLHYICAAGVRYSYAIQQWDILFPYINHSSWDTILHNADIILSHPHIQPKKRTIYFNLIHFMHHHNIHHNHLTIQHLTLFQKHISGIGVGCIAWCNKYFTSQDQCVEYTDIFFKKGFHILYNTHSLAERKKKALQWQQSAFGRIASLMLLQIGGYIITKKN